MNPYPDRPSGTERGSERQDSCLLAQILAIVLMSRGVIFCLISGRTGHVRMVRRHASIGLPDPPIFLLDPADVEKLARYAGIVTIERRVECCWGIARRLVNRIFLPRVNALRVREGLAPDRDVMTETWAAERLNLVAVSPSLIDRPMDWDQRHEVCGFLVPPGGLQGDNLARELEDFLVAGAPPIYVTFGSMLGPSDRGFIEETLAIWEGAAHLAGCRAILQTPTDVAGAASSDQVLRVRRAPYLKAFPRCAAVVHHGGAGTTQASLRSGRPSLVVAHVSDQFFWGSELERLGVAALTLRRKGLTARKLAAAVRRTLSRTDLAPRAAEIGSRMALEDGVGAAVRLIEQRLLTSVR